MILELIEGTATATSLIFAGLCLKNKIKKVNNNMATDSNGHMLWAWHEATFDNLGRFVKPAGFKCPKCTIQENNKHSVICSCEEHYNEHFHFTCVNCNYKNIMRTADDSPKTF